MLYREVASVVLIIGIFRCPLLRGGILRSLGDFLETLSQQVLVGIILIGRLGVHMAHFQLGSFLIGLVSNWARF